MSGISRIINGELAQSKSKGAKFKKEIGKLNSASCDKCDTKKKK